MRSVLAQPKRVALLAYLCVNSPRGFQRRETLLGLFWPELDQPRARNALNQAVHFLRRSLEEGALVSRGEELMVDPGRVWCDVLGFEQALAGGRMEEAFDLYSGELMPGFYVDEASGFERWLEDQRERLRRRAAAAAWASADRAEGEGDTNGAARWARRAAELEPDSEASARRLISLLSRLGDRGGAFGAFEAYARRLREEYGASPSPATDALVEQLRATVPVLAAAPVAPSRSVPSPPPAILTPQPDDVPASTPSEEVSSRGRLRIPRPRLVVPAFLTVVVLAVAWWTPGWFGVAAGGTVGGASGDRFDLIVSDFGSATGDSVLARVVPEALKIDLAQSSAMKLMDNRSVRQALARMEVADAELTSGVAHELAMREGVDGLLTGDVVRVGEGYLISVRLIDPVSDETVAAFRETATDSSAIIGAIDRLSAKLRRGMGESLRELNRSQPLERVTTGSLVALRNYSLAVHAIDVLGDYRHGIELLEAAVDADSGFAMAHRKLGVALLNQGESHSRVLDAYDRAFRHRDRLTERERYLVTAAHHSTSLREAIIVYAELLERWSDDVYALNNIGYLYGEIGDYRNAARYYRRAVAADSNFAIAPSNLVAAEFNQGRIEEAREALERFARAFPRNPRALEHRLNLEAATGNYEAAVRVGEKVLAQEANSVDWQIDSYRKLASLAAIRGKLGEARGFTQRAMEAADQGGSAAEDLAAAIFLASVELHTGGAPDVALAGVSRALQDKPLGSMAPGDRPLVELAWLYADAGQPEKAKEMLAVLRRILDPRLRNEIERQSRSIQAAVALAERRGPVAVELLSAGVPPECPICALPGLGRAYEQAGRPDSAVAVYTRYFDTPYLERLELDAVWLPFIYRRLTVLYPRLEMADEAERYARKLASLWKGADPGLRH